MTTFEHAIEHLLTKEGAFVDDAADRGGATKFGISTSRYPSLEIATLTREQAIELYRRDFWNPLYERLNHQGVADKLLELTVHLPHGVRRPYYATVMEGVRLVQRACRALGDHEIELDGQFGPQTLQAVRLERPEALLAAIRVEQARYYLARADAHPDQRKFLRGWLRRAVA